LIVHENPLAAAAAAAGTAPFEAEQQGPPPPLFNTTTLLSGEDGDKAQTYGADGHRYDDLGADGDSNAKAGTKVQGTPRQVPLFMAAVVDDTDNDLGGDEGVTRAVRAAVGAGDGGRVLRASVGASSEAVFEQEVQRSRHDVPATQLAQGIAAEVQPDRRQSAPSHDSEFESELV
jgi:hypothetical protein